MTKEKRDRPPFEKPIYRDYKPKIIDEFWDYDRSGEKEEYAVIVGNGRSLYYLRADTKEEAKKKARKKMKWLYENPHVKLVYIEKIPADERRRREKAEADKPKHKWKERIEQAEQEELERKLRRK